MASSLIIIRSINKLLASQAYKPFLALLKGLRNGVVYGVKIRAPHAFVMTFLFKEGRLYDKLKVILEATFTHAKNLASFVFIYKSLTTLLQHVQAEKSQLQTFIAAFFGGYIVFGENNKVNEQINLYLLSRILMGLARVAVKKGFIPEPKQSPFPLFAAIVWGIVLWLFEYERDSLQGSLRSSMVYLYDDSNVWNNIRDFLFYNKYSPKKKQV